MKKTLLASAIALSLGSAASVQAQTITITQMDFFGPYAATGTLNSDGTGNLQSIDDFFSFPWYAWQKTWFDTHTGTITWAGSGYGTGAVDAFSYTFALTGNQVAAGFYFDWSSYSGNGIPILTIFDCPVSGGGACTGHSLGMAAGPFPTQKPSFNGTTLDDFPISGSIPVPAAAWLMGSGLLGLVGVARRRRLQN